MIYEINSARASSVVRSMQPEAERDAMHRYFIRHYAAGMPPVPAHALPAIRMEMAAPVEIDPHFVYPVDNLAIGVREDIKDLLEEKYAAIGEFHRFELVGAKSAFFYWLIRQTVDLSRNGRQDFDIARRKHQMGFFVCSSTFAGGFYQTYRQRGWSGLSFQALE